MNRLRERHPACISGLPRQFRKHMSRSMQSFPDLQRLRSCHCGKVHHGFLLSLMMPIPGYQPYYEDTKIIPLLFSWEGQRLICSGGEFDGYTVNMIGGVSVSQLYERFRGCFPLSMTPGLVMFCLANQSLRLPGFWALISGRRSRFSWSGKMTEAPSKAFMLQKDRDGCTSSQ